MVVESYMILVVISSLIKAGCVRRALALVVSELLEYARISILPGACVEVRALIAGLVPVLYLEGVNSVRLFFGG